MIRQKKVGGYKEDNFKKFLKFIIIFLFFSRPAYSNIVNDFEIEELLNEIVKPIAEASNFDTKRPYFYIVLDNRPNAFVDPSNRIFLSTGFIAMVSNPESIAGVIAHEIAHIKLFHINQRLSNIEDKKSLMGLTNILSLSTSILTNNPDFFLGSTLASNEIIKSEIVNYSKDQEREADILALKYLEKSKISSFGLTDFLKKMILIQEKIGIKEEELNVITHPYKKERIEYIKKFQKTSKHNNSFFSDSLNQRLNFVKAKIDGYTLSLESVNKRYNNLPSIYKDYALAISYARAGYLTESIKTINSLIKKFPNNAFFYETKGEILMNFGYPHKATQFFNKSLNIKKSNDYLRLKTIEYMYQNIENKEDARNITKQFNLITLDLSNNNKILNLMIDVYEYLDEKDLMYLNLSAVENNKKNNELALLYLEKAKENSINSDNLSKIKKLEKKILENMKNE